MSRRSSLHGWFAAVHKRCQVDTKGWIWLDLGSSSSADIDYWNGTRMWAAMHDHNVSPALFLQQNHVHEYRMRCKQPEAAEDHNIARH